MVEREEGAGEGGVGRSIIVCVAGHKSIMVFILTIGQSKGLGLKREKPTTSSNFRFLNLQPPKPGSLVLTISLSTNLTKRMK